MLVETQLLKKGGISTCHGYIYWIIFQTYSLIKMILWNILIQIRQLVLEILYILSPIIDQVRSHFRGIYFTLVWVYHLFVIPYWDQIYYL